MPISPRKNILAITLALTILISSSVLSNTNNSNHYVAKAVSKKDFLHSSSLTSHHNDGFFYKTVDGHRNTCYNEYKLASIVCTKDGGTSNDNSSTASSLGSSTYYLYNYSRITPSNIGVSNTDKNSNDNSDHNPDNNQNNQVSDNHNQHLNKLQKKIDKLQSRIDKLREESRTREVENYGSKSSFHTSTSPLPPSVPTALTNSTLENTTNNNSALRSLTIPPPAALSSSPATSNTGERTILTQDTSANKSSTTNWVFNNDESNSNNYTYTSGLASSPVILPVGNTHKISTDVSTPNRDTSTSSPSKPIDTINVGSNAITNSIIASNPVIPTKLLQDAVHVVWDDNSPESPDVYYRTNAGDVFDRKAVNLSNNPEFSQSPAIAVSGNNVHIIWSDNGDILYRRSIDGGATFGSTINLSNNPENSFGRAIAVSGNNVYVVWSDAIPGNTPDGEENAEISYRRSTDGGATFGSTINLSNNDGLSQSPAIAVSSNNVYVVWGDNTPGNNEISYRRSTNNGATFGSTINLSNSVGDSQLPAIAVSGNNVYVVWQDSTTGDNNILYRRSTNNGATFGSTINLSNSSGGTPDIAASANGVHVTWSDSISGYQEIYYKRSTNNGATFGSTINLSNNSGLSQLPTIAVSGNNVYVVWQDSTPGDFEILLRKSVNGGTAFGSTINVSQSNGNSFSPDISVSPNNY